MNKVKDDTVQVTDQFDTSIKVLDIIEQDDGGATVQLEMGSEAVRLLAEKGILTLIKEMMEIK